MLNLSEISKRMNNCSCLLIVWKLIFARGLPTLDVLTTVYDAVKTKTSPSSSAKLKIFLKIYLKNFVIRKKVVPL